MATYLQADRHLTVTTPLGPDVLLLRGFQGSEGLSQLFRFELDLASEIGAGIPFDQLLGQSITAHLRLPDNASRHFSGICCRVAEGSRDSHFTYYRMEVVPQVWFLTRIARSRIFQQKAIPEILKEVLAGLDVDYDLSGTFHSRDYCVQYRETDFAFVSRLMEEEGIYYFFQHTEGGHRMILANTPQGHLDLPVQNAIDCELTEAGGRGPDRITAWEKVQELRSGKVTLWDHTFELPHQHLDAEKQIIESVSVGEVDHRTKIGRNDRLELYDYPGAYAQRFDGITPGGSERPADLQKIFEDNARTTEIRMQQEAVSTLEIRGASNCRYLVSGHKFTLQRHHNANGPYVLTTVEHKATLGGDYRSEMGGELTYENQFTCIPAGLPYRPQRKTPRPIVQGTQTAVVVGPADEEIFCDKYSRVKVQFHWDREGKNNADSSCWVRVGTPWAGRHWGMIHIPRIGHEVIVAFEEGDPDRPIIVGSVYNADTMPPFGLPGSKSISGIKSDSTPGGGGYNELVFDDTKGNELIRVHGQFDMDSTIEHDLREHVFNNRSRDVTNNESVTIGVHRTRTVGSNETITIGANRTETVIANETVTIGKVRTHTVGLACIETIGAAKILTIGAAYLVTVGAGMVEAIGGARASTIGGYNFLGVGGRMKETIGGKRDIKVGGNLTENVGGDHAEKVTGQYDLKAKDITIKADDKIVLTCGSASIVLESNGKIMIKGTEIELESTGQIGVVADSTLEMAGANFELKATSGTGKINTTAILDVKGSMVKINC